MAVVALASATLVIERVVISVLLEIHFSADQPPFLSLTPERAFCTISLLQHTAVEKGIYVWLLCLTQCYGWSITMANNTSRGHDVDQCGSLGFGKKYIHIRSFPLPIAVCMLRMYT